MAAALLLLLLLWCWAPGSRLLGLDKSLLSELTDPLLPVKWNGASRSRALFVDVGVCFCCWTSLERQNSRTGGAEGLAADCFMAETGLASQGGGLDRSWSGDLKGEGDLAETDGKKAEWCRPLGLPGCCRC